MCGHDWCSVRISKEIVEFASGKADGFERERVVKSPALNDEQRAILEKRGNLPPDEIHRLAAKTKKVMGGEESKASCHSDVASPEDAQRLQGETLVQLGRSRTAERSL
jgi:phosphomethylpyrimidine synthase